MRELLDYVNAGGSLAQIALLYLFWRLDRRVVRVETLLKIRL